MNAIIWTQEGCGTCIEEKSLLKAEGYDLTEIIVDDVKDMDRDAFAQLNIQDGMYPVVRIGGEFRIPAGISARMEW